MNVIKKSLCVFLCFLLCAVAVLPACAMAAPRFGDANDDGNINMKDILVLRSYLAGVEVEMNTVYADADASGSINMKDVLLVRKYVAGIDVDFGSEDTPLNLLASESDELVLSLYKVNPDGEFGYELWVGAENVSTDCEIEVDLLAVSINDVTSMPLWSATLSPGQGEVAAVTPSFELFGGQEGESVEKIGLYFVAMDTQTGEWVDCGEQPCVLFVGDETAYEKEDRTPQNGLLLLDNEEIKIAAADLYEDPFFGIPTMDLYMENRTDRPLMYVCESIEVDGQQIEAVWLCVLLPGTNTCAGMMLLPEEGTEIDLFSANTINFSVDAYTVESLNEDEPSPLHSYNVAYTAE